MAEEMFPANFMDEGGVQIPYIPTQEEMENCGWAKRAGVKCPREEKKTGTFGGPPELVNCATCPHHPWNTRFKEAFESVKTMPNYEKLREKQNELLGLPKDAHRRRM